MSSRATNVLGCILAGGAGRRLGGRDKGLLELDGRPLVEHCRDRLAPQVDAVLVSANRHQTRYRRFVPRVVGDDNDGIGESLAGPLAGILAAMRSAPLAMIACVPCDSPFFPRDLVQRLRAALSAGGHSIAVARTPARLQPVFALFRPGLAADLAAYLGAGERKIDRWYSRHDAVEVSFADEAAFANINTPDELEQARERLAAHT